MNFAHESIITEMKEAVALLWRWRRYYPAISGNSLWCWAAGKPAKDIDLFVKDSPACQRNLVAHYGPAVSDVLGVDVRDRGYNTISEDRPVAVFKSTTPSGKPVDVVVTEWKGYEAFQRFDYGHLMVAFGITTRVLTGATNYKNAQLVKLHGRAREEGIIRQKIQDDLWGSANAEPALKAVFAALDEELKLIMTPGWVDDEELDRLDREKEEA